MALLHRNGGHPLSVIHLYYLWLKAMKKKFIDFDAAEIDLYLTAFALKLIAHCFTLPNEVRLIGSGS